MERKLSLTFFFQLFFLLLVDLSMNSGLPGGRFGRVELERRLLLSPSGALPHQTPLPQGSSGTGRKAETLFPPEPCVFVAGSHCGSSVAHTQVGPTGATATISVLCSAKVMGARAGSSVMSLVTTHKRCVLLLPDKLSAKTTYQMLLKLPHALPHLKCPAF